ncbi:MAG: ABC transporter permease [Acidobacteriaceae bacterium]
MTTLLQDFRYAFRQLRKSPGFAITAILTLALGIGANTAIFSLFDQVMLRNMPVRDPGRLVLLKEKSQADRGHTHSEGDEDLPFSYPAYRHLRDENRVMQGLLASSSTGVAFTSDEKTEQTSAELVSGNYFEVLGTRPALGRLFTQADDTQKNGNPVVVLSYAYWKSRFGADPGILNRTVRLNGNPFVIIGIAPEGYTGLSAEQVPNLFVPMSMEPQMDPRWPNNLEDARSRWLNILGRLKPGVSRKQAEVALNPIWHNIRQSELEQMTDRGAKFDKGFMSTHLFVESGGQGLPFLRSDFGKPLIALMAMVIAVLLIACANIANLMLVRAAGRRREMAVRGALGASRARIFRQVLCEGLLLGTMATLLGIMLGQFGIRILVGAIPAEQGLTQTFSTHLDARILVFTALAAMLTTLLFSFAPALAATRLSLANALHDRSNAMSGGGSRLRSILVSGEVMLSLLLLIAAGLFARTLFNVKAVNTGFTTDHLLTFSVNAKLLGHNTIDTRAEYERILDVLRGAPGVRNASYSMLPLLSNDDMGGSMKIGGYVPKPGEDIDFHMNLVAADFFSTLQAPLLAGRGFTDGDKAGGHKVGIVNSAFAIRFFGSPGAALGHMFCYGCGKVSDVADTEIVGVVGNIKSSSLRDKPDPFVFLPYAQSPDITSASFFLRTTQPPELAAAAVRNAVANVDRDLPIRDLESMDAHISNSIFQERLISGLSVAFGALAALLAAVGLYGVLAYSVAQRTQEIGVRMALGASRLGVVKLVLRQVLVLSGIGILLAIPISLALAKFLQSQLYGISSHDPAVLLGVIALLLVLSAVAGIIPARRAAGVDPMKALRME